ncbi:hypothetical protein KDL29_10805 [bacterium]|nr:hypothetical protein [bacterium]
MDPGEGTILRGHPLRDRRPWLQLLPFLLPFLLLGIRTASVSGMRVPPHRTIAGALEHSELVGMDPAGRCYVQDMDSEPYSLHALDWQGREHWSAGRQFDVEWSPLYSRIVSQQDGTVVAENRAGMLVAFQPDGTVAWRFAPFEHVGGEHAWQPYAGGVDNMPPFTCWNDHYGTLYALDYEGRLLWSTEAWTDSLAGNGSRYCEKDGWEDGSILVTVLADPLLQQNGKGEYMLRRLYADGTHEDLWQLDLHGRHSPPVQSGDRVLCMESSAGRGLMEFRDGRMLKGYMVLDGQSWDMAGGRMVLRELDRGLGSYDAEGRLEWHVPQRGIIGKVACAEDGRTYLATALTRTRGPLENWAAGLAWQEYLRLRLGLHSGGQGSELRCYSSDGSLEWTSVLERSDMNSNMLLNGNWLAIENGMNLEVFRIGR